MAAGNITARLDTPVGSMTFELYQDAKPVTVTNFLRYIRDGLFVNSFAHRLPIGFVLQGGAFTVDANNQIQNISAYPAIVNEAGPFPQYSNVTGTLVMAKLPDDPDSATSSWFINLKDNNTGTADEGNLDLQNSGFTVFGKVITGSSIVTRFANFTNYNPGIDGTDLIADAGGALSSLPLKAITGGKLFIENLIFTTWTILGGPVPVITSPSVIFGAKDSAFSYQITAANSPAGAPASFSVTGGTLPAGLSLNAGTGLISGTPTSSDASLTDLTLNATNTDGTGSATLTISINAPVIGGSLAANGTVGEPFHYQIMASNTPTSYASSTLPAGLSLDASTGLISGTPTEAGGPTYVFINASNAGGTYTSQLAITIGAPPAAAPTIVTTGKVTGKNGAVTLKGSADAGTVKVEVKAGKGGFKKAKGSPASWKFPVKGLKPGKYKFQVRATNASGQTTTRTVVVTIKP